MTDWISTKEAMSLLGVGSTTIKRWANDGRLPCYRTAGGHRRFRAAAVHRLARGETARGIDTWAPEASLWLKWLLERDLAFVAAEVRSLTRTHGDWFAAADFLGRVMQLIGQSWANNDCTLLDAELASTKLAQSISASAASLPVSEGAPRCLVIPCSAEQHGLGALLTQLCLRSIGLSADLLESALDTDQVASHVDASNVQVLILSSSAWQTDAVALRSRAERFADICKARKIGLVLGGTGAWPADVEFGHRSRTFVQFHGVLDRIGLRR